ncbi:MAG: hypothetical protein R3A52_10475 [Polyangiales bacterium]
MERHHKRYARLCDLTAGLTAAGFVWVALSLATGHAYLNVVATVFAGATAAAWVALRRAQTPRLRAQRRAFEKWREFESRWSACVALLELIEELPRSDHATVERVLRETTADDELAGEDHSPRCAIGSKPSRSPRRSSATRSPPRPPSASARRTTSTRRCWPRWPS